MNKFIFTNCTTLGSIIPHTYLNPNKYIVQVHFRYSLSRLRNCFHFQIKQNRKIFVIRCSEQAINFDKMPINIEPDKYNDLLVTYLDYKKLTTAINYRLFR